MAIRDLGGRVRSEQTPEEVVKLLKDEFDSLSPEEREAVLLCLKEMDDPAFNELQMVEGEEGPPRIIDVLNEAEFKTRPVDIETFVMDPYYLGKTCDVLYPKLKEDMKELFSGNYGEAVLTGCVDLDASIVAEGGVVTSLRQILDASGDSPRVLAYPDGKVGFAETIEARHSGVRDTVRITVSNGASLRLTPEHKVMTRRGWVEAKDVVPGEDFVRTASDGWARIDGLGDGGTIEVGDIGVPNGNSFFCEGFQVHNSIGWGKSVVATTSFVDGVSGRRMTIEEAVDRDVLVPSLDGNEIAHRPPSKIWKCGHKQCFRMTLASGQYLEASKDHPVLTPIGYVPLLDLAPGSFVAAARSVPEPIATLEITDECVKVAAYLIADGSLTANSCVYIKGDEEVVGDFKLCAEHIPGFDGFGCEKYDRGAWYTTVRGAMDWVRSLGIDCLSKEKRVPAKFFGLNSRQLALFLNRLFTDGNVYTGSPRKIEIALASEGLIDDVQYLLRRFGVVARKSHHKKSIKQDDGTKEWFDAWRLQIADAPMQLRFLEFIGKIPGKESKCDKLLAQASATKGNPNWDLVPITTEELKVIRRETGPHTNKEWNDAGGALAKGSCMGRDKFQRLCRSTSYQGEYRKFADMDVVWERIESIDDIGWHDVYDLTVPGTENAVANGIIIHNTFFASIAACRILYELSCMRDPHKSFGIGKGSDITLIVLSVKEDLAIKVAFENIVNKIKESDYFMENFPYKPLKKEIQFPNHVQVAARASTDSAALGLNVFAAMIDESNFMAPMKKKGGMESRFGGGDRAQFLYDQLMRRMKSRFQKHGKLPGMMLVVSSKQTRDDFTAKRIKESADDPTLFVRDYATWHVKPKGTLSEEMFSVLVGNDLVPSKILEPDEVEAVREKLQEGMVIVDVPIDYRNDFDNNLEDSIRDVAGIATVSVSPFIQQLDKIVPCIDVNRSHPFSVEEWVQTDGGSVNWTKLAKQVSVREGASMSQIWQPKFYPGLARHVHIDPSLNSDSTGFAIGCVTGYKTIVRRDPETQEQYTEPAPRVWVDMLLRINPPIGGEIDYGMIRALVYQFQHYGFSIGLVTMDQFNSADSLQKFSKKGITAERLSVDKPMDAYDVLKSAIYENRISFYDYKPLLDELKSIQRDNVRNKVDHPRLGSKDVSDALAGITYSLTTSYHGSPMGVIKGISNFSNPEAEEQREMVEDDTIMLPFLQG